MFLALNILKVALDSFIHRLQYEIVVSSFWNTQELPRL